MLGWWHLLFFPNLFPGTRLGWRRLLQWRRRPTNLPVQFLATIALHYPKQRKGMRVHLLINKCFPQISCCIFLEMEKNEDWGMMEKENRVVSWYPSTQIHCKTMKWDKVDSSIRPQLCSFLQIIRASVPKRAHACTRMHKRTSRMIR